ncbi:hypothetical protein CLAFUW4_05282 [Fulvia fulva]|nr:hypothetical protein CLAFUR4_05276 [Fulvia fulva]WPV15262.1 hypothetical protein CLAFUW4_05282 [Fulvia fulva]WPV30395.1 hypothetical protein CLAFUW7_05281 [Fulvia fulva]
MADDHDFEDGDLLNMDDAWFYMEDEIELADELAEGQLPDPGYAGNNYENDAQAFDFDLYHYWDDLEYADDAYDDYHVRKPEDAGKKRKHTSPKKAVPDKRQKTSAKGRLTQHEWDREDEPVLFHSLAERYQNWRRDPPLLKEGTTFGLLPDWKTRFAGKDGAILKKAMPAAMKQAAEGEGLEDMEDDEDGQAEDEEWEDEPEGGLDMEAALKAALEAKLGTMAMDDADKENFMQTMLKMMSGEGGDDAANELTDALLGKVTSETGNEALSGWLSGQGVSLEEDDDASSIATTEQAGSANMEDSPVDSAVGESIRGGRKATQMPLHSGSPIDSKKRSAPLSKTENERPGRKQKKVKFDVPSSSDPVQPSKLAGVSDDSGTTVADSKQPNAKAVDSNPAVLQDTASKSRKRKAAPTETTDPDPLPVKRTRKRELDDLGPVPDVLSPAPPAKRIRSARAKSGK